MEAASKVMIAIGIALGAYAVFRSLQDTSDFAVLFRSVVFAVIAAALFIGGWIARIGAMVFPENKPNSLGDGQY